MKNLFLIIFILLSNISFSQNKDFDKSYKKELIDSIAYQLNDKYVFPDVAHLMASNLLKRLERGEYNEITNKKIFADSLKSHLFKVSKDKHIGVSYDEELALQLNKPKEEKNSAENFKRINERVRKFNYGFEELKIMKGNVGYVKITGFSPTKYGGKTATSAMQFVSNCDALIFDLRVNYGGDDTMIQLLISYLYSNEPVHLTDFYHRKENKTTQS